MTDDARRFWAGRFQTLCADHLTVDEDGEIMGTGPASYALANEILTAIETARSAAPRCAECRGTGQVSRSWGYIPCDACGGKGF